MANASGGGSSVIKQALPALLVLHQADSVHLVKAILTDNNWTPLVQKSIQELCYNYLYSSLPFTQQQRDTLKKHTQLLINLSDASTAPTELQQLIVKHWQIICDCILAPLESSLKDIIIIINE